MTADRATTTATGTIHGRSLRQQRELEERRRTNAKYAARDVLLPTLGRIAIERVLEDGEAREDVTEMALQTTPWTQRLTPEERALITITDHRPNGESGFEVTLGDGSVWTINVSAERVR